MRPHRRLMDPSTLEMLLMLRLNKVMWSEKTNQDIIDEDFAMKLRRKRRPMMEKKMTICLSGETSKNKRSILINIAIHLLLIIPSCQYIYLLITARRGDIVLQYIFLQDWTEGPASIPVDPWVIRDDLYVYNLKLLQRRSIRPDRNVYFSYQIVTSSNLYSKKTSIGLG